MEARTNSPTPHTADVPAEVLAKVMHGEADTLHDVVALLSAIADRVETATSASAHDDGHATLRLAQMARAKVERVLTTFDAYI